MTARPAIDVSRLPPTAFDTRAPVWWGNTLMMLIESTTVALLVVSYFYLRQNFPQWPPPRLDANPPLERPLPDLGLATADVVLLVGSAAVAVLVDLAARRLDRFMVLYGLAVLTLVGLICVALRFAEFQGLKFRWDDNAYSSTVWAILTLHLLYLILAAAETGVLVYWIVRYGMDAKHAVDVTLTMVYWYWMVGVWVILYGVVFWAPRIL